MTDKNRKKQEEIQHSFINLLIVIRPFLKRTHENRALKIRTRTHFRSIQLEILNRSNNYYNKYVGTYITSFEYEYNNIKKFIVLKFTYLKQYHL